MLRAGSAGTSGEEDEGQGGDAAGASSDALADSLVTDADLEFVDRDEVSCTPGPPPPQQSERVAELEQAGAQASQPAGSKPAAHVAAMSVPSSFNKSIPVRVG